MDPLQSSEIEDDVDNENLTIVTRSNADTIRIELGGSHTTSTETESTFNLTKKNVTFEDEEQEEVDKQNFKPQTSSTSEEDERTRKQPDIECSEKKENLGEMSKFINVSQQSKAFEPTEVQQIATELTEDLPALAILKNQVENASAIVELCKSKDVQHEAKESGEISQQFEKIIDMFDSFAKNLGSLDFVINSNVVKRPKRELIKYQQELEEPLKHRSRYEGYLTEDESKTVSSELQSGETGLPSFTSAGTSCTGLMENDNIEEYCVHEQMAFKETKNAAEEDKRTTTARSVSTTTANYELKSLACQTQNFDHISINEISILDGLSLTSRSEQPQSLNNYAQAENACTSYSGTQPEATKQPLLATLIEQPLTSPTVTQETSTTPPFSVITIEANSRPSSTDLVRPSFCHRLWELIGDFCAATFLCLQVNKDCIFCLGFFAAFVVSASFLTAFFYHTLIISQSLWQTEGATQY